MLSDMESGRGAYDATPDLRNFTKIVDFYYESTYALTVFLSFACSPKEIRPYEVYVVFYANTNSLINKLVYPFMLLE